MKSEIIACSERLGTWEALAVLITLLVLSFAVGYVLVKLNNP